MIIEIRRAVAKHISTMLDLCSDRRVTNAQLGEVRTTLDQFNLELAAWSKQAACYDPDPGEARSRRVACPGAYSHRHWRLLFALLT